MRTRQSGFTLVELMVVVVIVAILASIAYPSYTQYVIRTRRTDAQSIMLQIAALEEKYYTQCSAYTATVPTGTVASCNGLGMAPGSISTYYTFTVALSAVALTPPYTITAAPVGGTTQASDPCGSLTLDAVGTKNATGGAPLTDCWRR